MVSRRRIRWCSNRPGETEHFGTTSVLTRPSTVRVSCQRMPIWFTWAIRRFSRRCTQRGVRPCDRCWRGSARPARRRRSTCRRSRWVPQPLASTGRTSCRGRCRSWTCCHRAWTTWSARSGSPGPRLVPAPESSRCHVLGLGAAAVLLTDGARGMHLVTADPDRFRHAGRCFVERAGEWADREFFLPASKSRHVVTTGAGDASTAGLLFGILSAVSAGEAASIAAKLAAFKVDGGGRSSFTL